MRKLKLFYIVSVLFFSLTGCYTDPRKLEPSNLPAADQEKGEQNRIISSYITIYKAIKNRELEKVITLLQEALKDDKGVDLMQVDDQGRSLLHVAIDNAGPSQEALYLEIVRLLIKLKQDVNARDKEANTPLHIATKRGLFLVAEELVKNGANIYAENEQGEIPLHYAAHEGNIELVRLLTYRNEAVDKTIIPSLPIDSNYINKKDNQGRTPLYLVMYRFKEEVYNSVFDNIEKYVCIVKLLIALGADVHTKDKYDMTLLHLAAGTGCEEIISMLLKEKVEINPCNKTGNSPLELAIWYGALPGTEKNSLIVANMLIEAGANVHHTDEHNYNLLHIAAMYGNKEIVELLIRRKVGINLKDNKGCTPLHLAVEYARNLKEEGYLKVIDLLIQAGAMIDSKNDEGHTPLQVAIKNGSDGLAIALINKGANVKPTNSHSLLHEAISWCSEGEKNDAYITIIKYLISLGVGIQDVDDKGNTPLHFAATRLGIVGFQEVIKLLIDAGANIAAVNKQGSTPFLYMEPYIRKVRL